MSSRWIPAVLALQIATVLAGCGQPAPGALQVAPSAARPEPAAVKAVAPVTVTVTRGASDTIAPTTRISAPSAPEAHVAQTPSSLFAIDYNEAQYKASTLAQQDPEAAAEIKQAFTTEAAAVAGPGGFSWGKIGGSIGAGLVGTSLLGYFVYAGMVGSKDLMTPVNSTFKKTPAAFDIPFEQADFHAHDGLKLSAWYVPAATPTNKAIVLFHGHTSNKDTMFDKYGHWLHQKYNLFLYDSRYHGESEGKFTTLGYYERHDAQIALDLVKARGNTSVGVMGESMGGAVAIHAAAKDKSVRAALSDCAFDSYHDAIAPRAKARKYPMPDGVAFAVVKMVSLKAKGRVDQADPVKFVDDISPRPVLIIHGKNDDDTTPVNGEKLFNAAKEPKTMWWTQDTDHAESISKYPVEYKQKTFDFFDAAL